jgi:hypothetical protein
MFFFRDHEVTGFWMVRLEPGGEMGEGCGAGGAGEDRGGRPQHFKPCNQAELLADEITRV